MEKMNPDDSNFTGADFITLKATLSDEAIQCLKDGSEVEFTHSDTVHAEDPVITVRLALEDSEDGSGSSEFRIDRVLE